jgi:hypothetical protein
MNVELASDNEDGFSMEDESEEEGDESGADREAVEERNGKKKKKFKVLDVDNEEQ